MQCMLHPRERHSYHSQDASTVSTFVVQNVWIREAEAGS